MLLRARFARALTVLLAVVSVAISSRAQTVGGTGRINYGPPGAARCSFDYVVRAEWSGERQLSLSVTFDGREISGPVSNQFVCVGVLYSNLPNVDQQWFQVFSENECIGSLSRVQIVHAVATDHGPVGGFPARAQPNQVLFFNPVHLTVYYPDTIYNASFALPAHLDPKQLTLAIYLLPDYTTFECPFGQTACECPPRDLVMDTAGVVGSNRAFWGLISTTPYPATPTIRTNISRRGAGGGGGGGGGGIPVRLTWWYIRPGSPPVGPLPSPFWWLPDTPPSGEK